MVESIEDAATALLEAELNAAKKLVKLKNAEIDALKAQVADLKAELRRHIGLHIDAINNRT